VNSRPDTSSALGSTCELLPRVGQAPLEVASSECARRAGASRDSSRTAARALNAGDGRYVPVSPEMFAMLQAALWAYQESGGLVSTPPSFRADGRRLRSALSSGPHSSRIDGADAGSGLPEVLILDGTTRSVALGTGGGA